jgi:hypothetical protein
MLLQITNPNRDFNSGSAEAQQEVPFLRGISQLGENESAAAQLSKDIFLS